MGNFPRLHPPSQEATAVKPWRNAKRASWLYAFPFGLSGPKRPREPQKVPLISSCPGPCQDRRGSLMAEAGSEEAFGQTGGELEDLAGEAG